MAISSTEEFDDSEEEFEGSQKTPLVVTLAHEILQMHYENKELRAELRRVKPYEKKYTDLQREHISHLEHTSFRTAILCAAAGPKKLKEYSSLLGVKDKVEKEEVEE